LFATNRLIKPNIFRKYHVSKQAGVNAIELGKFLKNHQRDIHCTHPTVRAEALLNCTRVCQVMATDQQHDSLWIFFPWRLHSSVAKATPV